MEAYAGQQYIGIDLHRRRSVIVRTTNTGEMLDAVQITNSPLALAEVMTRAGEHPEVVLESTYGWYSAVDVLQAVPCEPGVHLAHPLGVKAFEYRRVKNDLRDAADLADLLRMGRLPESWISPPAVRELRELVPGQAGRLALELQGQGPRRAGQVRGHGGDERPVRRRRHRAARRPGPAEGVRGPDRVAAPGDRPAGLRDRRVRHAHARAV